VPILFGTLGSVFGIAPVFWINSLILVGGGLLQRGAGSKTEKHSPQ